MNISHLIDTEVTVVSMTKSGTVSTISGKLNKRIDDGIFVVFSDSFLMYLLKRFFTKKVESCIMFHWSSVTKCSGNVIVISDLTDEDKEGFSNSFLYGSKEEKTL